MNVCDVIRRVRKEKGLSQTELAKKSDVHLITIWHLENGKNVGMSVLERVCKCLDLELKVEQKTKKENENKEEVCPQEVGIGEFQGAE